MLTMKQKQIFAGALVLALGVATGVVVSPDDGPARDDKLAEIGSAHGSSAPPSSAGLDAAQYHRAVKAIRKTNDVVDLLTGEVAAGAIVKTSVRVELGARPGALEFVGPATSAFSTATDFACPQCGVAFEDDARAELTTLTITARNTSATPLRLTAFIHCTPRCVAE